MKCRTKIAIAVAVITVAGIAAYFIPVNITLTPLNRSVKDNRDTLTVSVQNINIYRIPISKARIDKTLIEPEDLASAVKEIERGLIDILFLKNGNGRLVAESGRHRGELALTSTAIVTADLKGTKPKSKLRILYDKHKHVEKVFLRDGMILYGVIFEKGNRIDFITPEGNLKLLKDDIVRVVYLKPENL